MKPVYARIPAHDEPVVALTRMGEKGFLSASQGTVNLWEYTGGSPPESIFETKSRNLVSAISPLAEGGWATGYSSGHFEVFAANGKLVHRMQKCSDTPVLFFQEVLSNVWIGTVEGVKEFAKWRSIKHIPRKIQSMSVFGVNRFLTAHDQGLECWTQNGFSHSIFTHPVSLFAKMKEQPSGVAASNNELSLWDLHPGEKVAAWKTAQVVQVLAFDKSRFITTHVDKTIKIWDIGAKSEVQSYNVGCVVRSLLRLGGSEFLAAGTKLSIFKL